MRIDPSEVDHLPLAAAMVDRQGRMIAATPEWRGAAPGSLSYHAGEARLVVGSGEVARSDQGLVMRWLLDEIDAAVADMSGERRLCAAVLRSGLELVAGLPSATTGEGTTDDVVRLARAAIRARVPELTVEVIEPARFQAAPAPAQIALALVQFAVNAAVHANATRLLLRVGPGPTFSVEWPSERRRPVEARGYRHSLLRQGWGLGYVRTVSDALGATALSPGPTEPGWAGACLSLGNCRLTLPLARFARDGPFQATQTWRQEVQSPDPMVRASLRTDLETTMAGAIERPGAIARGALFTARDTGRGVTWAALPPDTGSARVRDVLLGLDHEHALWSAPADHAIRIHSLITILARSLGAQAVAYAPDAFAREFPRSCAALGVAVSETPPMLICPDPRLTAFLLRELGGGGLVGQSDRTVLEIRPEARHHPVVTLLGAPEGRLGLTE